MFFRFFKLYRFSLRKFSSLTFESYFPHDSYFPEKSSFYFESIWEFLLNTRVSSELKNYVGQTFDTLEQNQKWTSRFNELLKHRLSNGWLIVLIRSYFSRFDNFILDYTWKTPLCRTDRIKNWLFNKRFRRHLPSK